MKSREELESLKRNWLRDPCWDIEETEGFEEHREELLAYRKICEDEWERAYQKEQKKGGPAFPTYTLEFGENGARLGRKGDGLTRRDYFAGQAITGILANNRYATMDEYREGRSKHYAMLAYLVADALIEAGNE